MSTVDSPGCLQQLLAIVVVLFALVLGVQAGPISGGPIPNAQATHAPATPPVAQPTIQAVLAAPGNVTEAQINSAVDVLNARLIDLAASGLIPAGGDARAENVVITVRFAEGELRTAAILQSLTEPGLLELADTTALNAAQIDAIRNRVIRTTTDPARAKADPRGPIFQAVMTNRDVEAASAAKNGYDDSWLVNVKFTVAAGARLGAFTEAHIGETLAIVIDGVLISAPTIQARVSTGVQITGGFTAEEAKILAIQFRRPALPFALTVRDIMTTP